MKTAGILENKKKLLVEKKWPGMPHIDVLLLLLLLIIIVQIIKHRQPIAAAANIFLSPFGSSYCELACLAGAGFF